MSGRWSYRRTAYKPRLQRRPASYRVQRPAGRARYASRMLNRRARAPTGFALPSRRSRAVLTGFPSALKAKLRWVSFETMAPTLYPGFNRLLIHANAIHQPLSGNLHQPTGYDQCFGNYDHVTVTGSRITVKPVPDETVVSGMSFPATPTLYEGTGGGNAGSSFSTQQWPSVLFGITVHDDAASPWTTVQQLCETPLGTRPRISHQSSGASQPTASYKFSAAKYFKKSLKSMFGDTPYSHTSSTDPTENAFYTIWCSKTSTTAIPTFKLLIQIEYDCVFTERKPLAASVV